MELNEIKNIFECKFEENITEYLEFCFNNKYDGTEYSEVHHILPRSKFPEYEFSEWNLVRLEYKDHIKAHILLAEIVPINAFIKPIRFMVENVELINKLKVKGMAKWKKSVGYQTWRDKHKDVWDSQKVGGTRHHHMFYMSSITHTNPLIITKRKENLVKSWTQEKRDAKSLYNIEKYKDESEREKLSIACKSAWENKSEDERNDFIKKRSDFNKSDEGRKKNSDGVRRAYAETDLSERLSAMRRGKYWWNKDGKEIKSAECPAEGWVRGRAFKYDKSMVEKRNATIKAKTQAD